MTTLFNRLFSPFQRPSTAVVPVTPRVQPPPLPAYAQLPSSPLNAWARKVVEKIRASVFAGRLNFLPYLDNGTEETPAMRRHYRTMLKESMIKAGFLTKVLSVASLPLQVNPEDKKDPRQMEAADFVKHACRAVKGGTQGLAWELVGGPLLQGWGVAEKVFTVEDRGRFAGKWKWKAIKAKDPESIGLDIDAFRNVTGIRSNLDPGATFDPADFVVVSHLPLYQNPFGMSDFRASYRAYWIKDSAWKLRGQHLERYTGPYVKGTYSTQDQREALELALADAHANSWVSVPTGAMIDVIDLSTRGTTDFESAIADCDREMLVGLLWSYLQVVEGSTPNARGDTQVHQQTGELPQWFLSTLLAQTLNEGPVPELVELNYADVPPPTVSFGAVSDSDLLDSAKLDQILVTLGMPLDQDERAEYYGRQLATDQGRALRMPSAAPAAQPFAEGDDRRPFPWETTPAATP